MADTTKIRVPRRPLLREEPTPVIQDFECPATLQSSLNTGGVLGDCQAEESAKLIKLLMGNKQPRAWFRCRCGMKFQAKIKEMVSAPKPSTRNSSG
ncbi:hypothetical protein [uncultured Mediterranean phage]|jgi:hypothetical protein|nr:hypothetical protein [uncultured Mediterranean phage]